MEWLNKERRWTLIPAIALAVNIESPEMVTPPVIINYRQINSPVIINYIILISLKK